MSNLRGQTAMLELMIGTVLVLILLVAITSSFAATYTSGETGRQVSALSQAANLALDGLMRNPGSLGWENQTDLTGISSIGIAKQPFVLSESKIKKLKEFSCFYDGTHRPDGCPDGGSNDNYYRVKQLTGLDLYDFFLRITIRDPCAETVPPQFTDFSVKSTDGSVVFDNIGRDPSTDAVKDSSIVVISRAAILDSGTADTAPTCPNHPTGKLVNAPVVVELRVFAKKGV
ncbi:MAG: hypothetical protein V1777_03015 [Candidatus Micrarchaeota archaeon]